MNALTSISPRLVMTALLCVFSAHATLFGDTAGKEVKWKFSSTKWVQQGSNLSYPSAAGVQTASRPAPEGSFEITYRMRISPEADGGFVAGGWAGVQVNGVNLLLRPDGYWWPHRMKGEKRSRGDLLAEKISPGRWYNGRIVYTTGGMIEWYVGGRLICRVLPPGKSANLTLISNRMACSFADVQVRMIEEDGGTKPNFNLLANPSFEHVVDGLAYYWRPSHSLGQQIATTFGSMEKFWASWGPRNSGAFEGKTVMRLEKTGVVSHAVSVLPQNPYTFSCYLKSETDGQPATMFLREKGGRWYSRKIKLSTQWKRYSFTKKMLKGAAYVGIGVDEGVVWHDAAKLELGKQSTRFVPEKGAATTGTSPAQNPVFDLPFVEGGFKLDGRLDEEFRRKALHVTDFRLLGTKGKPSNKTEAWLATDGKSLLIAVLCKDDKTDAIKCKITERDGNVWTDECVELFLNPEMDRENYIHIAVNPDGVFYDARAGDSSWDRQVKIKTHRQSDAWSVEIAIPLASLDLTPLTGRRWGINLGRQNHVAQEISSWANIPLVDFHQTKYYPQINWPDRVVFDKYLFDVTALKVDPQKSGVSLSGDVYNRTPRDRQITAAFSLEGQSAPALGLDVARGRKTAFTMAFPKAAPKDEAFVSFTLKDARTGELLREGSTWAGFSNQSAQPVRTSGTYIDPRSGAVVDNGKPRLIFAPSIPVWKHNLKDIPAIMREYARGGFTEVLVVSHTNRPESDQIWTTVLDEAQRNGLKVLFWFATRPKDLLKDNHLESVLAKWRKHPALLAWLVVDEPELHAREQDVKEIVARAKKADPDHPVFINLTHLGPARRYAGLPGDVLMIDYYLTSSPTRTVGDVLYQSRKMVGIARQRGMPAWSFLAGDNHQNHYREPTPGEHVAQAYGNVIEGVTGLMYFMGHPLGKEAWKAYKRTGQELKRLTPVIFAKEARVGLVRTPSNILYTTRRHDGNLYIIAVNITDKSSDAVFRLTDLAGTGTIDCDVMFEGRKIPLRNGTLKDRFAPYQRHVYVIPQQGAKAAEAAK